MRGRLRPGALTLHRHALPQLAADGVLVALSLWLAYRLRFDGLVPDLYADLLRATLLPAVVMALVCFALSGVYRKFWRYSGQRDYARVVQGAVLGTLALVAFVAATKPVTIVTTQRDAGLAMPSSVIALFLLLTLVLCVGVRFGAHAIYERPLRGFRARRDARRLLIVGAGDGGRLVLREVLRNPELGLTPAGFIDDDPLKARQRIDGVKVLGGTDDRDLVRVLDELEPDEVTIAIPSAPGTLRGRVVKACRDRGIPVRTMPTVFELLQGAGTVVRQVRDVRVEDVLGREPVRMDVDRAGRWLEGEVVLVTGAGGSIGSELCRQISRVGVRRLVLLDHSEEHLFTIQRELLDDRHVHPDGLSAVLADVKDGERMREVIAEHRPTVVFHAAAYKHVGLMELNPVEAIRNNALATRGLARLCGEAAVKTFLLVSTDKAVSPATVMGASKALAEYAVGAAQQRFEQTRYASVRFGNVLGSSGSVVPIFRRQIALGGPVTVTDRRMQRYFMTIPEAVQLVIRAGSLADGTPRTFVLDMGEPVGIWQLAEAMIELSGLEPGVDIAIEEVGRRPGEKLDEQLFNPDERVLPTPAEKIRYAEREPLDPSVVEAMFDQIALLVLEGDAAGLAAKVAELSAAAGAGTPAGLAAGRRPPI